MRNQTPTAKIPDWLKGMPNHTQLGRVEIAQIFSVHTQSVIKCVNNGTIPAPTVSGVKKNHQSVYRWQLGDIRKWIAEKEREQ